MLTFPVLCLLVLHQGSAMDLLRGLQCPADPLLISSCLRQEKAFSLLQTQFGTQKWWYDKLLGKTPAFCIQFLTFSQSTDEIYVQGNFYSNTKNFFKIRMEDDQVSSLTKIKFEPDKDYGSINEYLLLVVDIYLT